MVNNLNESLITLLFHYDFCAKRFKFYETCLFCIYLFLSEPDNIKPEGKYIEIRKKKSYAIQLVREIKSICVPFSSFFSSMMNRFALINSVNIKQDKFQKLYFKWHNVHQCKNH